MASSQPNRLKFQNAKTLEKYYGCVNVGDFMGVAQTLNPEVVFSIPGDPSILPFSGEWAGHDRVMELFKNFIDAFWIVYMDETCIITSEDEIISFNDESFKVKTTGRYYRVGVVHHITFDEAGLIKSLTNIHDTYVAVQAFSGKAAIAEPILPPSAVTSQVQLSDREAHEFIDRFYRLRIQEEGNVEDYLDEQVSILAPGDPDIFPFSGAWVGKQQVCEFFNIHNSMLLDRKAEVNQIIANNDSIAAIIEESGKRPDTEEGVRVKRYELIQLVGDGKIGRISIYMDTFPLTKTS